MRRAALLLLAALTLAGCTDETPPHWADVCVASHTKTGWTLIPIGGVGLPIGKNMSMVPATETVCDRTERRCVHGKDYKGKGQC